MPCKNCFKSMSQLISLFLLLFSWQITSQNLLSKEDRKGNLFFKISSEYRIVSLFDRDIDQIDVVDVQDQTTGLGFNYAFDWFTGTNFSLGFSHTLRYDHILKARLDPNQLAVVSGVDTNGLLMDFHFYVQYHIKVFKNSELYVVLGRSLLNVGSDYNEADRIFDEQGEFIGALVTSTNTNYGSWNGGLGWKKNRYSILGGIYLSDNVDYFNESGILTIPYIRFSYNLGKL